MKQKRRWFTDAKKNHWWIFIDRGAIARAAAAGFDLRTLTILDLAELVGELFDPAHDGGDFRIVDLLTAVQLSRQPQIFNVDVETVVRGVTAFCLAMDDRFSGRDFYKHWKAQALDNMNVKQEKLATEATKA